MNPKHERLRELLSYDRETGEFVWRKTFFRMVEGKRVGSIQASGYWGVRVEQSFYLAHRLAWFFNYGEWPDRQIDHRNGDKSDNRIENLRLATPAQNAANGPKRSTNKSGYKGVQARKDGWVSYITKSSKSKYLGKYSTPELAHQAYVQAAREAFGEFANAGA